jgi:hypothetical protein
MGSLMELLRIQMELAIETWLGGGIVRELGWEVVLVLASELALAVVSVQHAVVTIHAIRHGREGSLGAALGRFSSSTASTVLVALLLRPCWIRTIVGCLRRLARPVPGLDSSCPCHVEAELAALGRNLETVKVLRATPFEPWASVLTTPHLSAVSS